MYIEIRDLKKSYGAVMPPLIAALVNLAFIRRRLSAPALQLIRKSMP